MRVKNQAEFVTQLEVWMRAGVQAIHVIAGPQAALAEKLIDQAYQRFRSKTKGSPAGPRTATWDASSGLCSRTTDGTRSAGVKGSNMLTKAIDMIVNTRPDNDLAEVLGSDACVILRDPHFFLRQQPDCLSAFKEAVKGNRFWRQKTAEYDIRRSVFLLTNAATLTEELSGYVKVIDLPLPVRAEIEPLVEKLIAGWPADQQREFAAGTNSRAVVCHALAGLTATDIEDVMSEAVVTHKDTPAAGRLDGVRSTIERQKADALKRTEALEYIPLEQVNEAPELKGYENLEEWVTARRAAYTPQAETLKLDRPKGLALTGIPGSGKSVAAKLIAKRLQKPLVVFDIAAVFGSLVGESERKMREALAAVTAMEDCVLLVDEIDKLLGGSHESQGDSGVTKRVLGKFLSWLAEKNDNIFVVFTMNRIEQLPPELTRRGRVDEIFWVDLPDADTRVQILKLHLERRGVSGTVFTPDEWHAIAEATDQFIGAELEEVVKTSRLDALVGGTATAIPTAEQMLAVIRKVRPLAKSDDSGLEAIRTFSRDRAVPVGRAQARTVQARKGGRASRGIEPSEN